MQSDKNTFNQKLTNVKSKEQLENRETPKKDDTENERKALKKPGKYGSNSFKYIEIYVALNVFLYENTCNFYDQYFIRKYTSHKFTNKTSSRSHT